MATVRVLQAFGAKASCPLQERESNRPPSNRSCSPSLAPGHPCDEDGSQGGSGFLASWRRFATSQVSKFAGRVPPTENVVAFNPRDVLTRGK